MKKDQQSRIRQEGAAKYQIESVERACRIIHALENEPGLALYELAEAVSLSRASVFRLVATLQANGMISRDSNRKYRLTSRHLHGKRMKFGYVSETSETYFYRAVSHGLVETAARGNIDLIVIDSGRSPDVALKSAERLMDERVDLILEFHSYAQIDSVLSARASHRKVPLIAIEMPHPNATYFGVDNCQAGLVAGRFLARWAEQHWKGQVDEVILIGATRTGSLPEARLTGSLLGIQEVLPNSSASKIISIDGKWRFDATRDAVKRHLLNSSARRILVSAIFDQSALGALEAFRDADRLQDCAVVGQNGSIEARQVMRHSNSRLIGSVGYFPERYGEQLIPLALDIVGQKSSVPRAIFIKHQMLTPKNVREYYPKEAS